MYCIIRIIYDGRYLLRDRLLNYGDLGLHLQFFVTQPDYSCHVEQTAFQICNSNLSPVDMIKDHSIAS